MGRLKDKVAIITGGARGLGASIAKTFYKEKAKVIICDVLLDEAKEIANLINGNAFKLDVSNPSEVNLKFNEISKLYDKIDILVNNAGINGFEKRPDIIDERNRVNKAQIDEFNNDNKIKTHFDITVNMTDDDWFKMINTHLSGTFFCTREVLK